MARPLHANAEETKQRLVAVALPKFAQHGFDGTSTRELADAAGCTMGTINHHFGNKQGLYDATVDAVYRRLRERTVDTLASVHTGNDLYALIELLYSVARAERDGVRLLVRQVLDHGRLTPHTEAKHFLPEIDKATQLTAQLAGVQPEQARTAAVTLGYLLSRFVIQDDRSLMTAFGVRSAKDAHNRVVNTLTATARALFARKE
jgi:AcrR family transcriptional regulator